MFKSQQNLGTLSFGQNFLGSGLWDPSSTMDFFLLSIVCTNISNTGSKQFADIDEQNINKTLIWQLTVICTSLGN